MFSEDKEKHLSMCRHERGLNNSPVEWGAAGKVWEPLGKSRLWVTERFVIERMYRT